MYSSFLMLNLKLIGIKKYALQKISVVENTNKEMHMNLLKDSKTKENLMRAFTGESQARNRYTFGEEASKKQQLNVVEIVFRYTADQERAHAKVFFDHLKELSGQTISIDGTYPVMTYDNLVQTLRAAQEGEYHEWDEVYKSFANTAREEGFIKVANSFEQIAAIEKTHGDRFGEFAEKLESGMLFKSNQEEQWICLNCGHIHTSKEAPKKCPVCEYPQGYFILYAQSPFVK